MAQSSSIEWTETTWNPVTGCQKISPGCKNCYAERMAKRLNSMGQPRYANGFDVTLQDDLIERPLSWKSSRIIFVNSMSDLFHKDVPIHFIKRCFDVMNRATQHQFQVLTKRPERVLAISNELTWTENIWMGTSVENQDYVHRARTLGKINANIRFLSIEPLLGPICSLPISNIEWVIVGGESGPNARPVLKQWVQKIRDRCVKYQVPFFFKQWGGVQKSKNGRVLDGRTWDELPIKYGRALRGNKKNSPQVTVIGLSERERVAKRGKGHRLAVLDK